MASIDTILSAVETAINPTTGVGLALETAVLNAAAAGTDMSTNADAVHSEAVTDIGEINDQYAALETKLDSAASAFDAIALAVTNLLASLEPDTALAIDAAKLVPTVDVTAPATGDVTATLTDAALAADRGIESVAAEVQATIAGLTGPMAIEGLDTYGLDTAPDLTGTATAEAFVTDLLTAITGILADAPTKPTLGTLATVTAPDLAAYAPDIAAANNAYLTILNELDSLGAPPDLTQWNVDSLTYAFSAVWNGVQTIVLRNLQGGTGLDPDAEAALWNRDRERKSKAIDAAVRRTTAAIAARGFAMPPGRLNMALAEVMDKAVDADLESSREIAYKQAELMQSNMIAAVDAGLKMELAAMDIAVKSKGMEIEVSKFMSSLAMEAFKLHLETVKAKGEIMGIAVNLIDAQIKVMLSQLEQYKAELSAEQLKIEQNKTLIQEYATEMSLLEKQVALSQITGSAIKLILDSDSLKTDAIKTRLQGYQAYIAGAEADHKRYSEELKTATVPVDVQRYLTEAYQVETGGIAANNAAQLKNAEALVDRFKGLIALYGEEARVGMVEVDRYKSTQGAYNDIYKTKVEQETLKLDAAVKSYQATIQGTSAKKDIIIGKINLAKWKLDSYAKLLLTSGNLRSTAYSEQIKALGAQLGQAYSALNAIGMEFKTL